MTQVLGPKNCCIVRHEAFQIGNPNNGMSSSSHGNLCTTIQTCSNGPQELVNGVSFDQITLRTKNTINKKNMACAHVSDDSMCYIHGFRSLLTQLPLRNMIGCLALFEEASKIPPDGATLKGILEFKPQSLGLPPSSPFPLSFSSINESELGFFFGLGSHLFLKKKSWFQFAYYLSIFD